LDEFVNSFSKKGEIVSFLNHLIKNANKDFPEIILSANKFYVASFYIAKSIYMLVDNKEEKNKIFSKKLKAIDLKFSNKIIQDIQKISAKIIGKTGLFYPPDTKPVEILIESNKEHFFAKYLIINKNAVNILPNSIKKTFEQKAVKPEKLTYNPETNKIKQAKRIKIDEYFG